MRPTGPSTGFGAFGVLAAKGEKVANRIGGGPDVLPGFCRPLNGALRRPVVDHGLRRGRCGGLRSRRRNHIRGARCRNPDGLHRRERNRRRRSRSRCGRNLGLRFRRFGSGCDKLRSRFRFWLLRRHNRVSAIDGPHGRAVHHDRSLIERGHRFGLWCIAGQRNTWPRRCRPQQQLWQRACSGDNERHHRNRAAPEPLLDHALSPRGKICSGPNQPVAQSHLGRASLRGGANAAPLGHRCGALGTIGWPMASRVRRRPGRTPDTAWSRSRCHPWRASDHSCTAFRPAPAPRRTRRCCGRLGRPAASR